MPSPRTFPYRIDRCVQSTKWLAAGIATLLSPFILHAVGLWIRQLAAFPVFSAMFAAGAGLVIYLCRTDVIDSPMVRSAIAFERRCTQGIISRLLLAPQGRWLGKGNWVILASPYFLPVAMILLWIMSWFIFPAALRSFVIGFGVAYHVASVIIRWKSGSPESRRLGMRFAILFLVPANLFVIGAGYAFALKGFTGLLVFVKDVFRPITAALHWLY
jgi:hypothetical protein